MQGGTGYARKISFQGIKFEAVDNPIQIEQYYCPLQNNCKNEVRTYNIHACMHKIIILSA